MTAGCWASQNSAATSEYVRQVSTAQLRMAQLESQLVESQLHIEELQEVIRLQGKNEATRLENLDQVNAEVARLRGTIEVLQFEMSELKRALADQQIDLERRQLFDEKRLAQVEKFLGVKPPPPPTDEELGLAIAAAGEGEGEPGVDGEVPVDGDEGEGAEGDEVPESLPETASAKLDLAAEHMTAGRQKVARAILKAAIEQNVGAPEMDEIRYRYAETFFNDEDWTGAVVEFNKVVNNHPGSEWACWSYYRQGEALDAMGKADSAKHFYQGAASGSCKNSAAAKETKRKL